MMFLANNSHVIYSWLSWLRAEYEIHCWGVNTSFNRFWLRVANALLMRKLIKAEVDCLSDKIHKYRTM